MILTVISRPDFFPGEANAINALFEAGMECFHLRKPGCEEAPYRSLLQQIRPEYRSGVILHEHFHLAQEYGAAGIHINSRCKTVPEGFTGKVSISCHTLDEIAGNKALGKYSSMFLSPIFDSISKKGYRAGITPEELAAAASKGIITDEVVALGGVCASNIPTLRQWGFKQAAVLGAVWESEYPVKAFKQMNDILHRKYPAVLTVAGSDSSGGAGIQADIKAISAMRCYAASVITAITAQNTCGVRAIHPVPAEIISAQLDAVFQDVFPDSVKIGMVNDTDVIDAIAAALRRYRPRFVVYDPVMVATSGAKLMEDSAISHICRNLIPLSNLITPNLRECEVLVGHPVESIGQMKQAAADLSLQGGCSVLVKGGHLQGDDMTDVLYHNGEFTLYTSPKIDTPNTHGTGCTLSSAIASLAALGKSMEEAVGLAKEYVHAAIQDGKDMGIGLGNGPLWHFTESHLK